MRVCVCGCFEGAILIECSFLLRARILRSTLVIAELLGLKRERERERERGDTWGPCSAVSLEELQKVVFGVFDIGYLFLPLPNSEPVPFKREAAAVCCRRGCAKHLRRIDPSFPLSLLLGLGRFGSYRRIQGARHQTGLTSRVQGYKD